MAVVTGPHSDVQQFFFDGNADCHEMGNLVTDYYYVNGWNVTFSEIII